MPASSSHHHARRVVVYFELASDSYKACMQQAGRGYIAAAAVGRASLLVSKRL
jgi:hypothetical protein